MDVDEGYETEWIENQVNIGRAIFVFLLEL